MTDAKRTWPELPYLEWHDTCHTLHLWTQVVGKVRVARTPWVQRCRVWQVSCHSR